MSTMNVTKAGSGGPLEVALEWYDAGFLPIPFVYGQKRALVKWSKYLNGTPRPPRTTISRWFSRKWRVSPEGVNLALLCGVNGLVCLDFDSDPLFWHWRVRYGNPFTKITKTPRGGYHVWVKVEDLESARGLHTVAGLEIKARGTVNDYPGCTGDGEYRQWDNLPIATVGDVNEILCDRVRAERSQEAGVGGGMCDVDVTTLHQLSSNLLPPTHASLAARSDALLPHVRPLHPPQMQAPTKALSQSRILSRTSPVDTIKSYGGIERLVAQYTTLNPSGTHHLSGQCPFHDDGTPSFWVDTSTQLCGCRKPECRSRQRHGRPMDVIDFYARVENISTRHAISELHRRVL